MTHLTIQLSFNFDLTESSLGDAIELLEFAIYNQQALSSLRAYNQIFSVLHHCRENNILSHFVLLRLHGRLSASHREVLALNEVY